ncbi:MAG: hypothetical protein HS108_03665 [Planctomycetes bacterium]|jgi:hypothetical protein|nr:hypothetical protein [Planctomycetota bacterium]MCL4731341.1 hypothetical protein [Planctomycetota bacterium]
MRPIVIAGPSANCGKTHLACVLASCLAPVQALKITRFHREQHCPVHGVNHQGQDDCDGCAPAPAGYELVDDPVVLATPGKDTDRLARAGASPVLWLRAAPHTFEYALRKAMTRFDLARPLVIEGNSAATVAGFEAAVVLLWPQKTRGVKASVMPALRRCDALVLVEGEESPRRVWPGTLRAACARYGVDEKRLPQPHWLSAGWWQEDATAQKARLESLLQTLAPDWVAQKNPE